jgi:hypothetical protein
MFLYLSLWVSDSPVILLDNGILACMLLLLLSARARRQNNAAALEPHMSVGGSPLTPVLRDGR